MGNSVVFTKFGKFSISSGRDIDGELRVAGTDTLLYLRDDTYFDVHSIPDGTVTGVLHDLTKVTLFQCMTGGTGTSSRDGEHYHFSDIFAHFVLEGRRHLKARDTPKKGRDGRYKPIIRKGLYFSFREKTCRDAMDRKAIEARKKFTQCADSVYLFIRQGCCYNNFLTLPEDVVAYCECMKELDQCCFENALIHISKAFAAKPDDVRYASTYFEIRLQLGDKAAIEGE